MPNSLTYLNWTSIYENTHTHTHNFILFYFILSVNEMIGHRDENKLTISSTIAIIIWGWGAKFNDHEHEIFHFKNEYDIHMSLKAYS